MNYLVEIIMYNTIKLLEELDLHLHNKDVSKYLIICLLLYNLDVNLFIFSV
jgi:hypothetical protein